MLSSGDTKLLENLWRHFCHSTKKLYIVVPRHMTTEQEGPFGQTIPDETEYFGTTWSNSVVIVIARLRLH